MRQERQSSFTAFAVCLALALVGAGCKETTTRDGGIDASGATLTSGQVAQVLLSVNNAEVQQAQIALGQVQLGDVRMYAQRMRDEHSAANQRQQSLFQQNNITPAESSVNQMLVQNANQNTQQLQALTGDMVSTTVGDGGVAIGDGGMLIALFDRTYIDIQYRQHEQVLDIIENVLNRAVQNSPLRDEVQLVRMTVRDHHDQAKAIQDRIGRP